MSPCFSRRRSVWVSIFCDTPASSLRNIPVRFTPRASEWITGMLHLSARIATTSALPGNLRNGVATERRAIEVITAQEEPWARTGTYGTSKYVLVARGATLLACCRQVKSGASHHRSHAEGAIHERGKRDGPERRSPSRGRRCYNDRSPKDLDGCGEPDNCNDDRMAGGVLGIRADTSVLLVHARPLRGCHCQP